MIERFLYLNMINSSQHLKEKLNINPEVVTQEIQQSIVHYLKMVGKNEVIIGLSGGLDSSVVTALCVRALGKENVKVLLLPDNESNPTHLDDATNFSKQLEIEWKLFNITPLLRDVNIKKYGIISRIPFINKLKGFLYRKGHNYYQKISDETPFASQLKGLGKKPYHDYIRKSQAILHAKHRLRMVLLYYYAEQEDRLVIGCTNKTEHQIGFFVKYGCDHLADLMPIIGLYKTQIYQLAKYLKIPDRIIQKEPSPDLLPGLDDKTMIGIPYEKIDLVLLASENNLSPEDISKMTGIKIDTVNSIIDLFYYAKDMRVN